MKATANVLIVAYGILIFEPKTLAAPLDFGHISIVDETNPSFFYVPGVDENQADKIKIIGNVRQGGHYVVPKNTTLIQALAFSGGPEGISNLGSVKIIDSDGNVKNIALDSDITDHIGYKLRHRDVIFVPPAKKYNNTALWVSIVTTLAAVGTLYYTGRNSFKQFP